MERPGRLLGSLVLLGAVLLAPQVCGDDRDQELPPPRLNNQPKKDDKTPQGPPILPPSAVAGLAPAIPVRFSEVLQLASVANLDIAQANLVVQQAQANLLRAQSTFLPNLNVGSTYTEHEGAIQRTEGTVVNVNRDALFVGMGTTLTFNISEAIYAIPEARRRLDATINGQVRVTNDTLLQVATAYVSVLRAQRQLMRLTETLDFLTSEQESELRAGSKGLLPLIRAFVDSGTGLPSDQARVEADVVRRMSEQSRAAQDVRTAAAELARLLHLNAAVFLLPAEDPRWPIEMPGGPWFHQPIEVLVDQGLRFRPELAENAALREAAYLRFRQSQLQPLVPSLVTAFSYGGFGGGPTVVGKTATGSNILSRSGVIGDFGQRHDLEVGLVWRLQGLGVGNNAQIWDNRVRLEQREVQQLFLQDLVVAQIVQALEQVQRAAERVHLLWASLFDKYNRPDGAVYRSLRLNFLRIKGGQGLPLEVLDSTRRLSDVLAEYANALSDLDLARFRLLIALGMPPAALLDPKLLPLPPNCSASLNESKEVAPSTKRNFNEIHPEANLPSPRAVDKMAQPGKNVPAPSQSQKRGVELHKAQPRTPLPDDGLQALPPMRLPQ